MSILQRYDHIGTDIGPQAHKILREFAYTERLSTYKIYSDLKLRPSNMAYKNTHKHVKRLEKLEFIEPVEVEGAKHGAQYFSISEAGMFQLFLQGMFIVTLLRSVEAHPNFLVFKTFLYPCFKKETLLALKGFVNHYKTITFEIYSNVNYQITSAIYHYLKECCMLTFQLITFFAAQKIGRKSDLGLAHQVGLEYQTTLLKNNLVMHILGRFRIYNEVKGANVLTILAQDDVFMKLADELHKNYERGFDIAMRLRNRS